MTWKPRSTAAALFAGLVFVGVASAGYVLVHERLTPPGIKTYDVRADLTAADGVAPGLGQPVRVAGVRVGSIVAASRHQGLARVTLEIESNELPAVYRDARVALVPITPLKDMQIELDPGSMKAGRLPRGGVVPVARTSSPAALADLLAALDHDTRDYLSSFIASLDEGSRGRALSVRRALRALGPTSRQVREVTRELDTRRTNLARLVHNLRLVTRAAGDDAGLRRVIDSGSVVLRGISAQQAALDKSLKLLPGTLRTTDSVLASTSSFAGVLGPTLRGLTPATKRLPRALAALRPMALETTDVLRDEVRPLVRDALPATRALAPALSALRAVAPQLTTSLRVANYALNELAYNPPGDDEGFLFWFPWWFHNYTSMFSAQDAHGSAARAMALVNCQQLTGVVGLGDILKTVLGVYSLCQGAN